MLYPMKMKPTFKDYLWGGDTLAARYGKQTNMRPVAESWEVSCYPGCASTVENGEYSGKTLPEVLALNPEALGRGKSGFPVLIKLIDAQKPLSLQVHPADAYARERENQPGKNEMWYIMDAQPGAELIVGFKRPVSKQELERAIRENTILELVNRVEVKKGDCYLIPAGLLHAIGGGILIAEIQQSSDVTYRVYDYNRVGTDGKPRPLHIEQAVDVTDSGLAAQKASDNPSRVFGGYMRTDLTDWDYFETSLLRISSRAELFRDRECFDCLLVTMGEILVESAGEPVLLRTGESAFIPAGLGAYALSGEADALLTRA